MKNHSTGSVSHWITGVKAGDSIASQQLWDRYFVKLIPLAMKRLAHLRTGQTGEDIALSALKSVMIGMQENRFPALTDRDGLWALLVTITVRKAISRLRRQRAQKRSVTLEISLADVEEYIGIAPTAEFAVEFSDILEKLVRHLDDPMLRQVVERKLAGCTNQEIARELGCSPRTVIRKLNRVRREWEADGDLHSKGSRRTDTNKLQ